MLDFICCGWSRGGSWCALSCFARGVQVSGLSDGDLSRDRTSSFSRFVIYVSILLLGYLVLKRSQRFAFVKNLFLRYLGRDDVHLEQARGSHGDNISYCTKEESRVDGPWELGVREASGSGRRTDLAAVKEMIDAGASSKEIADTHFDVWVKYRKAFQEYSLLKKAETKSPRYTMDMFSEPPMDLSKAVWLYGPSGVGKTGYAMAHFRKPLMIQHLEDLKQFDAKIHDGLVFDDMGLSHLPFHAVLRLFEMEEDSVVHCRYENAVIPAGTKRIFTHNSDVGWVPDKLMEGQWAALNRRIRLVCVPEDIRVVVHNNNNHA